MRKAGGGTPVALVSMPFVSVDSPSIQLGLLKAIVGRAGIEVDTFHLALDFARLIGPELYRALADYRGHLFGEWVFSEAAFGANAPDSAHELPARFADAVTRMLGGCGADSPALLVRMRQVLVPEYLESLLLAIPWDRFHVVGFTSSFQQNAASLALAGRIKAAFPWIRTVFGGANFDGELGHELVRHFPCIDFAVVGEGERALPALLNALARGEDPTGIPGVITSTTSAVLGPPTRDTTTTRMDDLPVPDYREFFERARALGLHDEDGLARVSIPFESARGCWWGEKQHCTFCGLNGTSMQFRSKSVDRVLGELRELADRHGIRRFVAVDNIMGLALMRDLLPKLISEANNYRFFYEVKVNLHREQIQLLRAAGVDAIQPGIESLSTHVLQLMRKGQTALQGINTLRWCMYHGIDVAWNLIWGFPGETAEDCATQLRLLAQITHLQPPVHAGRIWLERFSPLFSGNGGFPRIQRAPEATYKYVYPASVDLQRLAYFFDYEIDGALPESAFVDILTAVDSWKHAWSDESPPTLEFWEVEGAVHVRDWRDRQRPGEYTLTGETAQLYTATVDRPRTKDSLRAVLGAGWSAAEVMVFVDALVERGLIIHDDGEYLAAAVPSRAYPPQCRQRLPEV